MRKATRQKCWHRRLSTVPAVAARVGKMDIRKERDTKDFELWCGQKLAQLHHLSKERSTDFYGVCTLIVVAIGMITSTIT